jgi:hypothetical protein
VVINRDQIGECAANIDTDAIHAVSFSRFSLALCASFP